MWARSEPAGKSQPLQNGPSACAELFLWLQSTLRAHLAMALPAMVRLLGRLGQCWFGLRTPHEAARKSACWFALAHDDLAGDERGDIAVNALDEAAASGR